MKLDFHMVVKAFVDKDNLNNKKEVVVVCS